MRGLHESHRLGREPVFDPQDPAFAGMRVDFDVETLEPDGFRRLLRYWLGARGDRPTPPVTAIDPLALPRDLLPMLVVLDCDASTGRLRVRLQGTGLVSLTGIDATGRYLDSLAMPDLEDVEKRLGWCRDTGNPYVVSGPLTWADMHYRSYATLVLPFGGAAEGVRRLVLLTIAEDATAEAASSTVRRSPVA